MWVACLLLLPARVARASTAVSATGNTRLKLMSMYYMILLVAVEGLQLQLLDSSPKLQLEWTNDYTLQTLR
eukprot:451727-Pleurochrysis_carterae.AAC.2